MKTDKEKHDGGHESPNARRHAKRHAICKRVSHKLNALDIYG